MGKMHNNYKRQFLPLEDFSLSSLSPITPIAQIAQILFLLKEIKIIKIIRIIIFSYVLLFFCQK